MIKSELQAALEAKKGFVSIINDELAQDHVSGDKIEKRRFYINHTNSDGTMGKTFVYYLHNIETDEANFYNVEPEAVDAREPSTEQKKVDALENYLSSNFDAFFIDRVDLKHNWASATVYKLTAGKLAESRVIVYKKAKSPIKHVEIV